jgi:hypothetical protein
MTEMHQSRRWSPVLRAACAVALAFVLACGEDNPSTPKPTIPNLHGIGGWTEFDLFAVGDGGAILHYTGGQCSPGPCWRAVSSPTTRTLRDVVGFSPPPEAFAVGDEGTILHYNGSSWSTQSSPTTESLRSLWGPSATNMLAVGTGGVIVSNDGSGWTKETSPTSATLDGVWAFPAGEAYAVGAAGTVIHRVAGVWSFVAPFTPSRLRAVWADKPGDWFAVGDNGEIWQRRSAGWTAMTSPRSDDLYDVFGSDSAFVFAAGDADSVLFYDGFDWRPLVPRVATRLEGIWATICALPPMPAAATAGFHCSNTYFAGTSSVATRVTLLGSYEVMNDPR